MNPDNSGLRVMGEVSVFEILDHRWIVQINANPSSQDSSVGSTVDWYLEGPGFKSRRLQLNFQLEKGCRRDSKQ